jgi:hypothetical protein
MYTINKFPCTLSAECREILLVPAYFVFVHQEIGIAVF